MFLKKGGDSKKTMNGHFFFFSEKPRQIRKINQKDEFDEAAKRERTQGREREGIQKERDKQKIAIINYK